MRDEHRTAILTTLGLETQPRAAVRVNAGDWTEFPRRRLLVSTLAPPLERWTPVRRGTPWMDGFAPHPAGTVATMLRSRGQSRSGRPRPSCYQLAAQHLSYSMAVIPWRDMPLHQVRVQ
eukprot:11706824-Prorocentrum_lima.AAC.1